MFSCLNFTVLLLLSHCKGDAGAQANDVIDALVKRINSLEERLSTLDSLEERLSILENEGKGDSISPTMEDGYQPPEEVGKVKFKAARTCEELREQGATHSGKYLIDPDGELTGLPPIKAFCDFENGFTEILHGSDNESIPISIATRKDASPNPSTTPHQISKSPP